MEEVYFYIFTQYLHRMSLSLRGNHGDDITSLKKELAALRQMHNARSVDSTLALLRQHLARPAGIFGPHAVLADLEQILDIGRDKAD